MRQKLGYYKPGVVMEENDFVTRLREKIEKVKTNPDMQITGDLNGRTI